MTDMTTPNIRKQVRCDKGESGLAGEEKDRSGEGKSFLSPDLMKKIVKIIQGVFYGNVALVSQNFRLVQIDRSEKIRAADLDKYLRKLQGEELADDYAKICQKIRQQFDGLEYGQIVIVVNNGTIMRIERIEKQRFYAFTGLDGEGI
jgi:hypothetical protein